jgi:DNA-binding response OmpR family regulator
MVRQAPGRAVVEWPVGGCGVEMGTGGVGPVPTILLVDEDPAFRERIGFVLRREGFHVVAAADGRDALARWEAGAPDLVLLGARLPGLDGIAVCRRIRQASATPIVIVTAGPAEETALRAFAAGADDVLAKPVGLRPIAPRLRAILRRKAGRPARALCRAATSIGDLTLDAETRELRRGDRLVRLTGRELEILAALMTPPGRVVPYARLGADPDSDDALSRQAVQGHIMHLRRKLRTVAGMTVTITLLPRVGYRLNF